MADIYFTPAQIEDLFHGITARIYGFDIDSADPDVAAAARAAAGQAIRIAWPTGGAPAWDITEDRTFIRVLFGEDEYTKQREYTYSRKSDLVANQAMEMTNVLQVSWVVYGPHSFTNAFKLFTKVFDPAITLWTAQKHIYLIPDVGSPVRAPELYAGQWWERVDFTARYNAKVLINSDTPYLLSTDIAIETDRLLSAEIEIITDALAGSDTVTGGGN